MDYFGDRTHVMHQQLIMAGQGLIEPTIAIGGLAFSDTDTQSYPGGSSQTMSDDTFTVPNNWQTKDWTYKAQITSTASYVTLGFSVTLWLNSVVIQTWSQPASHEGYFRYNSGTLTYTNTMSLAKGDVVRGRIIMTGRNVGGSTPVSTNYHELKRIT